MATINISGFMHYSRSKFTDAESFTFFSFDASKGDPDYVLVGPVSFEYELPSDFHPIGTAVAALQKQRDAAAKAFSDTVRAIDEQIAKLTAIEHTEAA